ncbi:hypothetical protein LIA77_10059 [Sarocladium implicatum]|nr:hypothetical protein LIA77_10059 [Sarocladium implicatum]
MRYSKVFASFIFNFGAQALNCQVITGGPNTEERLAVVHLAQEKFIKGEVCVDNADGKDPYKGAACFVCDDVYASIANLASYDQCLTDEDFETTIMDDMEKNGQSCVSNVGKDAYLMVSMGWSDNWDVNLDDCYKC